MCHLSCWTRQIIKWSQTDQIPPLALFVRGKLLTCANASFHVYNHTNSHVIKKIYVKHFSTFLQHRKCWINDRHLYKITCNGTKWKNKKIPQLWQCLYVPSNTPEPKFYIKLFQLQINFLFILVNIFIIMFCYLVLFLCILGYGQVVFLGKYPIFHSQW